MGGKLQKQLAPIYDDLTNLCSHFHAVLDYPDEDIEDFGLDQYSKSLRGDAKALYALLQTYGQGRILRQGVAAAIVGKPNVGKSSLLNVLAGFDRCIVTDVPGTTRDTVEETVLLGSTVCGSLTPPVSGRPPIPWRPWASCVPGKRWKTPIW